MLVQGAFTSQARKGGGGGGGRSVANIVIHRGVRLHKGIAHQNVVLYIIIRS